MGKYLAGLWAVSFLTLRGLLLFNTRYDYLILIFGFFLLFSLDDGELEEAAQGVRLHFRNKVNYRTWFK